MTSTIQSYQKQLDELKLERDKHQADSKQGREKLSHALADMSRLRGERQAVLHEYNLATYALYLGTQSRHTQTDVTCVASRHVFVGVLQ